MAIVKRSCRSQAGKGLQWRQPAAGDRRGGADAHAAGKSLFTVASMSGPRRRVCHYQAGAVQVHGEEEEAEAQHGLTLCFLTLLPCPM